VRRLARPLAVGTAAVGLGLCAWIAVTLVWGEPVTSLRTAHAQRELRRELAQASRTHPAAPRRIREGAVFGRIVIPKLGVRMVVVQGTSTADLERGPGHYRISAVPGSGGTVAIAGHRTTYLHPFRHIDRLRRGDAILLEMPYGIFRYAVSERAIVSDRDWSILRRRRTETLVLTACHPLYSASHRIAVFASLRGVQV